MELTPDLVARFASALETIPFSKLVGVEVLALTQEEVRVRLPFRPEIARNRGILHGGAIFTLLDVTAGAMCAIAHGDLASGTTFVTVQANTQFLDAARHEDLECVARSVRAGKSLAFVDAEVVAGERAIARGNFVFKVVRVAHGAHTAE